MTPDGSGPHDQSPGPTPEPKEPATLGPLRAARPQPARYNGRIAYLAAGGSALAFYLNHWLLKRIDSGIIGLSALMVPVIAVVVGAFFAHERLGPRDLAGAAMVIGGVWLALGRKGAPHVKRSTESHSPA